VNATAPLWLDEPYAPRPALSSDARAEVCVIGGGIGGVATAWHLAQRGVGVTLLEAREVASGASGRNGGFFIAGAAPMYDDMRRRWGRERAAAIYRGTLEAQREMLEVAEAIGARDHFRVGGMLRLGVDAAEAAEVREHAAALAEDGFPGALVEPEDLPPALRRPDRLGLLTPHDGGVHPARWIRALAAAGGARIHERTRVLGPPAPDGEGVRVRTAAGDLLADRVVVAMDGGLAALVPAAGAVRPKRLNMVATAPAPPVLDRPVYSRHGYEYAQQLPDGRVTLGGYSDLDGDASWTDREELSAPVQARLERHLREELGVQAPVTHRWVGIVGYAEDPLPHCGALPGTDGRVLALGGYNGTGHVQAWVAARHVAATIAGEGTATPYAAFA
jgi:gamma-glutamylputrescine oxidase